MLKKYEVTELPKDGICHNLGNIFGLVLFQDGNTEHLTDEIAEAASSAGLPYFKEKAEKNQKSVSNK